MATSKVSPELVKLIERYIEELTYRDGGEAAKKTYQEIKAIATKDQLIKILEETR